MLQFLLLGNCSAGNFRNVTTNQCEACPVGFYQSDDLQDDCDMCPASYTTNGEGKTHRDNCTCKLFCITCFQFHILLMVRG